MWTMIVSITLIAAWCAINLAPEDRRDEVAEIVAGILAIIAAAVVPYLAATAASWWWP